VEDLRLSHPSLIYHSTPTYELDERATSTSHGNAVAKEKFRHTNILSDNSIR